MRTGWHAPFLVACSLLAPWAQAQDSDAAKPPATSTGKAGSGSVVYQLGFYDHADSGDGNPFLDESLTVIEAVTILDYNVTDRFGYGIKLSYDYVSSASIDRLSKFPDQSGASADNYVGLDFSMRYQTSDTWLVGGHLGASVEYDYNSLGLGLNAINKPRNTNTTLTYSLDAYLDDVDIIRFDGVQDGSESRTTFSGTVNWHQILTPTLQGEIGLTLATQSGFLSTPYNAVVVENPGDPPNPNLDNMARGTEIAEVLPDSRTRTALYGRLRYSNTPGRAWEMGSRLYNDDWGITGISLEPRLYQTLVKDKLEMRLRYRFYTQSESDYFQDSFTTTEEFRTQDSDLADLSSHTLGVLFDWESTIGPLSFGLDFTSRSDGLDFLFASFGYTYRF